MNFSIFQYNTHLFCGTAPGVYPNTTYEDEIRRRLIINKLSKLKADFITLEEVWSDRTKGDIIKALTGTITQFPYFIKDTIDSPLQMGSGLLLLSRHPLKHGFFQKEGMAVPQFTSYKRTKGMDALANKGFLTVQVCPINGPKFWLIHTHTQADYTPTAVAARAGNLKQITMRVKLLQSKFKQPIIVVGDLNVIAETKDGQGTDEYQEMKKHFGQQGLMDAFRILSPEFGDDMGHTYDGTHNHLIDIFAPNDKQCQFRLDYVFLDLQKNIKALSAQVVSGFTYEDPKTKQSTDLSDHYPISVKFKVDS
jgi:endonuclease/exonuclease/phosphatase family metal-dependent hydrolase